MLVTRTGTLQFTVESTKNAKQLYYVDLMEYDGNGICTCQDFLCRREKIVRKEGGRSLCKHLRACREYVVDDLIARIIQQNQQ